MKKIISLLLIASMLFCFVACNQSNSESEKSTETTENTEIETNEELPVVIVIGKMLKQPETYTDVRGTITADYQTYIEILHEIFYQEKGHEQIHAQSQFLVVACYEA